MSWQDDPVVIDALDRLLVESYADLGHALDALMSGLHVGDSPGWVVLLLAGRFSRAYNEARKESTASDSLEIAKLRMMEDPLLHHLVSTALPGGLPNAENN
jgi:hypothetical protein